MRVVSLAALLAVCAAPALAQGLPSLPVAAPPTSTAPNPALHTLRKPTGELDDCALLSETPAGTGIGATLLTLSSTYRVSPPEPGASPIIDIPITIEMR